jgi:hypothetical protein
VATLLGCLRGGESQYGREEGGRERRMRKREGGKETGELIDLALGTAEGTELRVARKEKQRKSVWLVLLLFVASSPSFSPSKT